jgi:hypothetical protein
LLSYTLVLVKTFIILIDGRVIASYSRGQIVLPKSNMLEETRRSRGVLSYSIKGELFGQDYRQQLPFHLIFCNHVLLSWIIPNEIRVQWRRGGISVVRPENLKSHFGFRPSPKMASKPPLDAF